MAGGNAIRGSRVGAGPMGEAERGDTAPRTFVSYWCGNGHEVRPSFSVDPGLRGEARPHLVAVAAPVRDEHARSALAALCLAHRSGTDAAASDRVATSHAGTPRGE